jgi:hypothetical protein
MKNTDNNIKLLNRIGIQVGLPKCYAFDCPHVATHLIFFKAQKARPPWSGNPERSHFYCNSCTDILKKHKDDIAKIEEIKVQV